MHPFQLWLSIILASCQNNFQGAAFRWMTRDARKVATMSIRSTSNCKYSPHSWSSALSSYFWINCKIRKSKLIDHVPVSSLDPHRLMKLVEPDRALLARHCFNEKLADWLLLGTLQEETNKTLVQETRTNINKVGAYGLIYVRNHLVGRFDWSVNFRFPQCLRICRATSCWLSVFKFLRWSSIF